MQLHRFALGALLAATTLPGQTAADVGLMMGGGVLTVIYGQSCGQFTCQPFQAGPTAAGQPYNVYVWGETQAPYVLAIDLPSATPCIQFPGLANSLVLTNQPLTLAVGTITSPALTAACIQGRAAYVLQFPSGTPPGVQFVLQGIAISHTLQLPAFTVAITATTA